MEFRRYLEIILRHRVLILSLVLFATVGGLVATYVLPEEYTASALVLIRPVDPRRVTEAAGPREKEILGFPLYTSPITIFNRSYAEIIQSRTIAQQVVDSIQLHQLSGFQERNLIERTYDYLRAKAVRFSLNTWILLKYGRIEETTPYESAIQKVQDSLSASEIRDTYLINIDANYSNPSLAAKICNSAAQAFVDLWRKEYRKEAADELAVLEDQLVTAESDLHVQMDAVEAYKEREGIVELNLQLNEKISDIAEFESDLRRTETEILEVVEECKGLQRQLDDRHELFTAATKISENPLAAELKEMLAKYEIDMAGLQRRFTPTHPHVMALRARIEETEKRLAAEEARMVSDETSTVNPVYRELEQRLALLKARLPALKGRRSGLEATIEQYRREMESLRSKTKELAKLVRRAETLEVINARFITEVTGSRVLEARKAEEMRVVSPAIPPLYPSGPIKVFYGGIAAGVSLIIGIGLAFFLEYINIHVRTIEEAESSIDLPVLATIPRMKILPESEFPEIVMPGSLQSPPPRGGPH